MLDIIMELDMAPWNICGMELGRGMRGSMADAAPVNMLASSMGFISPGPPGPPSIEPMCRGPGPPIGPGPWDMGH